MTDASAALRHTDARGVVVTAGSTAAVAALEAAVESFAAHRSDVPARLEAALALDPQLVRAHVLSATLTRLSGRAADLPAARAHAAAARASVCARGATDAEERLVSALEAWCARDADRAASALEAAVLSAPTDLLAVKAAHALHFVLGRPRSMRKCVERAALAWRGRRLRGEGAVLGCLAFSLLETGALEEAERVGRDACDLEDNAWSLHAVGHVFHTRGLAGAGAEWLRSRARVLEGVGSLALHVRWHEAVFAIAAGDPDAALAVYDRWLATPVLPDYRDFVNASSLLLRLERAGLDVGERWAPLADVAETHGRDHGLGFADVHYALALWAGDRPLALAAHLVSLERSAAAVPGAEGRTLREVAVPFVRALALRDADPAEAAMRLRGLGPLLPRLGGSAAQREVFDALAALWASEGEVGRGAARRAPGEHRGRPGGPALSTR